MHQGEERGVSRQDPVGCDDGYVGLPGVSERGSVELRDDLACALDTGYRIRASLI